MPLHNDFYHSHFQAELSCSGLQLQSLKHINAQDILRNGGKQYIHGGTTPLYSGKAAQPSPLHCGPP